MMKFFYLQPVLFGNGLTHKSILAALIEREMRKLFSVPDEKEARLWGKYMSNSWEPLNNLNSTIQDAGLYQGQVRQFMLVATRNHMLI